MRYTLLVCLSLAFAFFSCEKDDIALKNSTDPATFDASSDEAAGSIGSSSGHAGDTTIQAGQLTAGEWNDLDNWGFWKELTAKDTFVEYPSYWKFNTLDRVSLKLRRENGNPVIDAEAVLLGQSGEVLWRARTDNFGRAEFFPNLLSPGTNAPARLQVSLQGQNYYLNQVKLYETGVNEMVIPGNGPSSTAADVFFVFDATGSMGDELEYIKVEINDIIGRIQSNNSNTSFRLGSVFYRDEGDEYVTRTSNLSSNFAQVVDFINTQKADGGGDYPEAVHSALQEAIEEQAWQEEARARLLFLILDAPPHYQDDVIEIIQSQIQLAAQKGIKIIPVTASGIDQPTEFLMRLLSIATNGTYTFITDHSGIGNEHLEPTIGEYEVEFLNDLVVRLVGKYVGE